MKKHILYIDQLKFQKKSLDLLRSKFKTLRLKDLKNSNFDKIVSILLPMNDFYSRNFFSKFKKLRSIVTPTTGDIHLDKKYLIERNIKIINLAKQKGLNLITSTSELTLGHILNLTRRIVDISGIFKKSRKFKKYNYLLSNNKLTLGIVGMGRIGRHVADRANALGFKVIFYDPFSKNKLYEKTKSLKKLVEKSNILSIHMHYQKKYFKKFNKNILKNLKKPSYVINTSRGEFLDEEDLIKCLKNKIIDGAGLDVLHNEHTKKFRDNPKKNKLFQFYLKNKNLNLFITPKQGGSNKSAWEISEKIIINQLLKYEKNKI